jgi:hypothetical protein
MLNTEAEVVTISDPKVQRDYFKAMEVIMKRSPKRYPWSGKIGLKEGKK